MILAGDIGGTKVNLALYKIEDGVLVQTNSQQFVSKSYTSLADIISEFLSGFLCEIDAACFGIAGPIVDGECRTTNLPWEIVSVKDLQVQLGTSKVAVLNDLAATAYGMLYLKEDELISLNPDAKKQKGNCAVIAAGTGLGEAILYHDGSSFHPLATEGGHSDFAPNDEVEDFLLKWLRKRLQGHVSFERILCGDGIGAIYDFFKESSELKEPEALQEFSFEHDRNALISQCALESKNQLCHKTLDLFCKIYGAEAGNLALKSLSTGGVFIGGGIAPKILPYLTNGTFMKSFFAKGRFSELLKSMEVKVSLNQETALLGAVHYAKDKLL